jgi:hypothetical protein
MVAIVPEGGPQSSLNPARLSGADLKLAGIECRSRRAG